MTSILSSTETERIRNLLVLLSVRERELIEYFAKGYSNIETALVIGIAASTIKIHRSNVYKKLGVSTLKDLMHLLDVRSEFLINSLICGRRDHEQVIQKLDSTV